MFAPGRGERTVQDGANQMGDFVIVKALEDGVNFIGMTRGKDTRLQHTEKLDTGEVMIAQFTDNVSAIKVRGNALIVSRHGRVYAGTEHPEKD